MLALALIMLSGPFDPPAMNGPEDCFVKPLELRAIDYAAFGATANTVVTQHCLRFLTSVDRPPSFAPQVVGRTRFGKFSLFGQQLGYGINVVTRPGTRLGEPDLMYASPAIDLPENWQRALDKATYPAIAIGGAVVLTSVLISVLGK